MDNDERIRIFDETMEMCRNNPVLAQGVTESNMNQYVCYDADIDIDDMIKSAPARWLSTRVEVTPQKSFEAAKDYAQTRVCVLNFADYYVPGGRVKQGSKAQEECLCRVSNLYPAISSGYMRKVFYDTHIGNTDPAYSDDLIYTPNVIVFREDDEPNYIMSYDDWFVCDVITCAAPNNMDGAISPERQYDIFRKRFKWIIDCASTNKVDTLVLGAFGCGAFGNDPKIVAKACYDAVEDMAGKVGKIVLAVYSGKGDGGRNDSPNYLAFRNQFDRTYFERK